MKFHPACKMFPLMPPEEFEAFKADIKKRGVIDPVLIHDDFILDGRHRSIACDQLGIECPTAWWEPKEDESVYEFVLSKNLHRRSLTAGQRAAIAVEAEVAIAAEIKEREAKRKANVTTAPGRESTPQQGTAATIAAKLTGASPRSVERAKRVSKAAPDLIDDVKDGKKTLKQAEKEVKKRESKGPPPFSDAPKEDPEVAAALAAAPEFDALAREVHDLKRRIVALTEHEYGRAISSEQIKRLMKDVVACITFAKPFAAAPASVTKEKGWKWVTKTEMDLVPKDQR